MRRQLRFTYALLLITGLNAPQFAVAQVQIEAKGVAVQAWAGELHAAPPSSSKPATEPIAVDTKGLSEKAVVVIYDAKANRIAQRSTELAQGTWAVSPADFSRIGRVTLQFQADGKPVASANYSVKIGKESWIGLIAPGDKGQATLWSLPPGDMEVAVSYRVGGETKQLKPTPRFGLALADASALGPIFVTLPSGVDIVSSTPTPPEAKGDATQEKPAQEPKESPLGRFVIYFAGALVGAGAIFGLIRLVSANREAIDGQLGKLGVQIPADTPVPADPVPAPAQTPAGPTPQIILDDAQPLDPIPGIAIPAASNPRLVLDSGDIILLPIGSTSIGRDSSSDHALPDQTTLSRRHAEFARSDEVVTISDLGSTNGTFVNGVRLESGPIQLKPGDEVQFGALHTRYQI